MRILFLIPPVFEGKAPDINFGCNFGVSFMAPCNILYPATVLKNAGHEVEFRDCNVEKCKSFGLREADVVVFFTVYLSQKRDIKWARYITDQYNIKVIFMGPEPSYRASEFLINENCFVIRGEPEETILELVKEFEKKKPNYGRVAGITRTKDGKTFYESVSREPIRDLDKLPFPDRNLLKARDKYFNPKLKGRPTTTMLTSRQCWGQCTYCIPLAYNFAREIEYRCHKGKKPPMSLRSPKNIYRELAQIKHEGYKSVAIMDDNFMGLPTTEGEGRIIEICNLIKPLNMEWGCLARADQCINPIPIFAMAEAGCKYVDLGVESFNDELLKDVKKGITAEKQRQAINTLRLAGIEPKINILLGCSPLQTEEDIQNTVQILKDLNIQYVSFGIVTPHPMVPLHDRFKKEGYIKGGEWVGTDPYHESIVQFPHIPAKRFNKLVRDCYHDFYLRPSYLWGRIKGLKSFSQLIEELKVGWRLLK